MKVWIYTMRNKNWDTSIRAFETEQAMNDALIKAAIEYRDRDGDKDEIATAEDAVDYLCEAQDQSVETEGVEVEQ